ncbi:MAG: hypothetical protein Kow0073_01720 [Immundisolibacter sp.]
MGGEGTKRCELAKCTMPANRYFNHQALPRRAPLLWRAGLDFRWVATTGGKYDACDLVAQGVGGMVQYVALSQQTIDAGAQQRVRSLAPLSLHPRLLLLFACRAHVQPL